MEQPSPLKSLRQIWPTAASIEVETLDTAPPAKGAYILLIRLDEAIEIARKPTPWRLAAGWYVYAGSAKGPGGIHARLQHHFQREKRAHWHVDHLTLRAGVIQALALEGGSECAIIARLLNATGFMPGPAGFGSSDCACCPAHLLVMAI